MSDITKAIRLSAEDWDDISSFLKENPFFDFSSLARMAIQEFVRNPKIEIRPIPPKYNSNATRSNDLQNSIGGSNG